MSEMLPFVEDTDGQKLKRYKDKSHPETSTTQVTVNNREATSPPPTITSFSYDQVNDDADELIELRGEGRYFGVTDLDDANKSSVKTGPICDNCHKRGHKRANCKVLICHKCGKVGDHCETQCPMTLICLRCGEKGHYVAECKSKTRKKQYCRTCDSFQHGDENCPTIWRSYLTKRSANNDNESCVLPVICCYNCGSSLHYGDECPEQRSSRVPNLGSAFSGNNLPKKLRPLYFSRLRRSNERNYYKGDGVGVGGGGDNDDTYDPLRSAKNSKPKYNQEKTMDYRNGADTYSTTSSFGGSFSRKTPSRSGYVPINGSNNFQKFNSGQPSLARLPVRPSSRSGNYSSNGSRNFNVTGYSPSDGSESNYQPTKSGVIRSRKSDTQLQGRVTKPTRSGLIESSKTKMKKSKHIRY